MAVYHAAGHQRLFIDMKIYIGARNASRRNPSIIQLVPFQRLRDTRESIQDRTMCPENAGKRLSEIGLVASGSHTYRALLAAPQS